MRDKYLYVINNVLEGYDREAVENHVEELEQQNNELMEFAKEMREIGKLNPDRLPEYTDIIYHHANDLITRITGGER